MTGSGWRRRALLVGISFLLVVLPAVPTTFAAATLSRAASPLYNVTFSETGLPSGTNWNITFGGTTHSTNNTSTTFSVANGDYPYLVTAIVSGASLALGNISLPALEQYRANSSIGVVKVNGSNVQWPTTYTTYFLLFTTGTPAAGGITSPGIGYYPTGSTPSIEALSYPGYTFSGWAGICTSFPCGAYIGANRIANVTMDNPTIEGALFTALTYPVNFHETGLPVNLAWSTTFNGSTSTSLNSTISYSISNGTYAYSVASPLPFGSDERFTTANTSGNVTVAGNVSLVPVSFTAQFNVSVVSASLSMGTVSTPGGWYNNGTGLVLSAQPNPGYAFLGWAGLGAGNYTGPENNHSLPVTGAITETAKFGKLFPVTFLETGLPASANWSLTLGTTTKTSPGSSLAFSEINGSYTFQVSPIPGYVTGTRTGYLQVSGTNASMTLHFHAFLYNVTFAAQGLANGIYWEVSTGSGSVQSNTSTAVFLVANGTTTFSISAGDGYTTSQSSVVLVVHGSPRNVTIQFIAPPAVDNGIFGIGIYPSYLALEALLGAALIVSVLWIKAFRRGASHRTKGSRKD